MKAAALVETFDAGFPERRALQDREIGPFRLMLHDLSESDRQRHI